MNNAIDIEKLCLELKTISSEYSTNSSQYMALKTSASALMFLFQKNIISDFEEYLVDMNSDLSPEQIHALETMGIKDKGESVNYEF